MILVDFFIEKVIARIEQALIHLNFDLLGSRDPSVLKQGKRGPLLIPVGEQLATWHSTPTILTQPLLPQALIVRCWLLLIVGPSCQLLLRGSRSFKPLLDHHLFAHSSSLFVVSKFWINLKSQTKLSV